MLWLPVVLLASAAAALVWGALRWHTATQALLARLEATREPIQPARHDARELDALPPPVRRYFRAVLQDGAPMVAGATLAHRGRLNLSADPATPRWKPFTSRQQIVVRRPGFVWDARVALLPGLAVHVHDAYVDAQGILHPSIAGLVTLADLQGTEELARGELMRFFAEAAWYPTALLPNQGVRWEPLDEHAARATLQDGPRSLTLTFRFGADDLIASVRAEARGRTVGERVVPTPWEGRWFDYRRCDGMLVPMAGEVAWLLPEGAMPYWRGTVTALRYDLAP